MLRKALKQPDTAKDEVQGFPTAAAQPKFQKLLEKLEKIFGKPGRRWAKCKGVYRFDSGDEKAINQAMNAAAKAGYLLIGGEMVGAKPPWLLFPTKDKYAVLKACQTNGANYGLSTDDVIDWLRDMEKTNPFDLSGCGFDFVSGVFLKPVRKPNELAERMVEFCPDVIDDEYIEDAAGVAEALRENQDFYFWWD
jgi:hypothetical protein